MSERNEAESKIQMERIFASARALSGYFKLVYM